MNALTIDNNIIVIEFMVEYYYFRRRNELPKRNKLLFILYHFSFQQMLSTFRVEHSARPWIVIIRFHFLSLTCYSTIHIRSSVFPHEHLCQSNIHVKSQDGYSAVDKHAIPILVFFICTDCGIAHDTFKMQMTIRAYISGICCTLL